MSVNLMVPVSLHSKAHAAETDILQPTTGWLVGPVVTEEADVPSPMPCLMLNQYSGGYSLRLSSDTASIYTVAIGLPAHHLKAAAPYDVQIVAGSGFNKTYAATAFDTKTLLVNADKDASLYNALIDADVIGVGVSGNYMAFSMAGVDKGVERLESCVGGVDKYTDQLTRSPVNQSYQAMALPEDIMDQSLAAADNLINDLKAPAEPSPQQAERIERQETSTGRWHAQKEAVTSNIQAAPKPQEAPQERTNKVDDIIDNFTVSQKPQRPMRQWRAARGIDLQDILTLWSKEANVTLVWQSETSFALPAAVSLTGNYEEAVSLILEQFRGQELAPTGKLYQQNDDDSQDQTETVLVISDKRQ